MEPSNFCNESTAIYASTYWMLWSNKRVRISLSMTMGTNKEFSFLRRLLTSYTIHLRQQSQRKQKLSLSPSLNSLTKCGHQTESISIYTSTYWMLQLNNRISNSSTTIIGTNKIKESILSQYSK